MGTRIFLACFALAIGIAFLPTELYPGDPVVVRHAAMRVLAGEGWSIPESEATGIFAGLVDFTRNSENGKLYVNWPEGNTLAQLPPLLAHKLVLAARGEAPTPANLFPFLNAYAVLLQIFLLLLAYETARLYTKKEWIAAAFALAALYSSLYWNYGRAQGNELFHILLATAVFRELALYSRNEGKISSNTRILRAFGMLAFLAFLRPTYWLSAGGALAFLFWCDRRQRPGKAKAGATLAAAILVCGAVLHLVHNELKFGSPFEFGFEYYRPHLSHLHPKNLFDSLPSLAIDPQFSVFLHFPLLLLALAGIGKFWKTHGKEWTFALALAAPYTLQLASLDYWRGEWCYGPRLFQAFLLVLSLPAIAWADARARDLPKPHAKLAFGAAGVSLLLFAWLQTYVHRLPFFAVYQARADYEGAQDSEVARYFRSYWPRIYFDLDRLRRTGTPLPFRAKLAEKFGEERLAWIESRRRASLRPNIWWAR